MPIAFPAGHHGSAFGAALLGFVALGAVPSIDAAAQLVSVNLIVQPDPRAAELYAELRPRFAALYDEFAPALRQ